MTNTKPTWEEDFDRLFRPLYTQDEIFGKALGKKNYLTECDSEVKGFIKKVEQEAYLRGDKNRMKDIGALRMECFVCKKRIPFPYDKHGYADYVLNYQRPGTITHMKCVT